MRGSGVLHESSNQDAACLTEPSIRRQLTKSNDALLCSTDVCSVDTDRYRNWEGVAGTECQQPQFAGQMIVAQPEASPHASVRHKGFAARVTEIKSVDACFFGQNQNLLKPNSTHWLFVTSSASDQSRIRSTFPQLFSSACAGLVKLAGMSFVNRRLSHRSSGAP